MHDIVFGARNAPEIHRARFVREHDVVTPFALLKDDISLTVKSDSHVQYRRGAVVVFLFFPKNGIYFCALLRTPLRFASEQSTLFFREL